MNPQQSRGLNSLVALADPTRRALLQLLRRQPMSVGELAEHLPVSRPAVSQHLQILNVAKLVQEERKGTRHYFRLNPEGFQELQSYLTAMWQDALNSFSKYVNEVELRGKNKGKRRKK